MYSLGEPHYSRTASSCRDRAWYGLISSGTMMKLGGKKGKDGGGGAPGTIGAGNQFSAAQLIQMEMAS